jgi:methyl-accepting chemotaxis protein
MKKTLYTIIKYSFSFAVIIGIAFNLAGIILVWRFVPTVSDQLVETATFIQSVLDSTEDLLEISDNALSKANDNITLISEATKDMADSLEETSNIAISISESMGKEFTAVLDSTQSALTSLESSAKLVDDTLSVIASIPLIGSNYSNKTPLYNSVVAINESLMLLPENMSNLQENLNEASSAFISLNENLESLSTSVEDIETNLEEAGEVIDSYQELVDQAQEKTASAIEKIPARVRWTAAAITLLFVWAILIQAGLIMYIQDMFTLHEKLAQITAKENALADAEK